MAKEIKTRQVNPVKPAILYNVRHIEDVVCGNCGQHLGRFVHVHNAFTMTKITMECTGCKEIVTVIPHAFSTSDMTKPLVAELDHTPCTYHNVS